MDSDRHSNLVWIDLEMSGLEDDHVILEIASLVTNKNLEALAEGPAIAIYRNAAELNNINEWSKEQHTKSGLLKRVHNSEINTHSAEQATLDFIKEWVDEGKSPICGNSIATDRRFIRREMPILDNFLHYRMIDVSTIKELVSRWYPNETLPAKKGTHLAMSDIRESIKELQSYKDRFFTIQNNIIGSDKGSKRSY